MKKLSEEDMNMVGSLSDSKVKSLGNAFRKASTKSKPISQLRMKALNDAFKEM